MVSSRPVAKSAIDRDIMSVFYLWNRQLLLCSSAPCLDLFNAVELFAHDYGFGLVLFRGSLFYNREMPMY
jgi:hypothetical protein